MNRSRCERSAQRAIGSALLPTASVPNPLVAAPAALGIRQMKPFIIFLTLVSTCFADVVGKLGAVVNLPSSQGWTFIGRTEIPEEQMDVWTARNTERRESIQFCVMTPLAKEASTDSQSLFAWERGLFTGNKEKVLSKDIELAGRKARYVVARWIGRDAPFFHFVMVPDRKCVVFFSIVSPTGSELGGDDAAQCVRSLHIDMH